jgi:hypothetical protein
MYKIAQNSAAASSGCSTLYSALFSYAAEKSASWQHRSQTVITAARKRRENSALTQTRAMDTEQKKIQFRNTYS